MKAHINPFLRRSLAAVTGVVFTQVHVLAADTTTSAWSGGTTVWGTAGNWAGGLPSTTVSALFNAIFSNQPTLGAAGTTQGIWLATGVGQDVTINSGSTQSLTLTGTAVLNSQTAAGIYMNDSAIHNLSIGPSTKILLSNSTGFYNQQASGLLTISGDLGLNAKTLTIGGGALSAGNVTIGGAIYGGNFVSGAGAVTVNSAGMVTLSNNNSYTGLTTMTGPGSLILGGTNTTSGLTFAGSNGTVKVTNAGGLGAGTITQNTGVSGTTLILASGSTTTTANALSFTQNGALTSTITMDAPSSQSGYTQTFGTAAFGQQGNLILNQTSNLTSTGTIAFGSSTFGSPNSGKSSQISPNGVNVTISSLTAVTSTTQTNTMVLDGTSTGNAIGVIANGTLNTAALTKSNTSTWALTGTNTYTGNTAVNGGTLEFKNTTGSALTQTLSGSLALAGGDVTLKSTKGSTGSISTTFGSYVARTVGNTANLVSSGGTNGTDNSIKFTTGPTASALIDKGLFLNGADYAVSDASGYLRAFNYTVATVDTGAIDVNLAANQATLGTTTSASNVQLRGTGNITALTNSTSGMNTLKILGNHNITLSGQVQINGLLETSGTTSIISGANLKVNATSGEFVIRVDGSSDILTINSAILANSNSTITKSGTGLLILGGSNTSSSSGTMTINGGTVQLNNVAALNSTAGSEMPVAFAAASTGILALNGNSVVVGNLSGASAAAATVQNANGSSVSNATLTVGNSANLSGTFAGTLKDGTGGGTLSLTKAGTGQLTLSGANTYTGLTTVNAGTLQFAKKTALYNNTPASWTDTNLVVNSGGRAIFNVGGSGEFTASDFTTLATLGTATGGFKSGSAIGMDTSNAGGVITYNTVVANSNSGANTLGFGKFGANTLILGGANSYTGGTTVGTTTTAGGTLQVNNAAALGGTSAGPVNVVNGTINFAVSTAVGTGIPTINLTTTTGLMTLNSGVTVNNPLTMGGGGVNQITGPSSGTASLGGAITWSSGQGIRIDSGGGTVNINGQISGTDAAQSIMFNRNTAGTFVLNAAANYSGGGLWNSGSGPSGTTILYGGTVKEGVSNALNSTAVLTFQPGATLDLNGNNQSALTVYAGTSIVNRPGIITNSATGTTSTITFSPTHSFNQVQGDSNAAYQYESAAINNGAGTVAVVKNGTAAMTFINTGTYTGGTTVNNGTLTGYTGNALGTGNVTVNGGTFAIDFNAFATAIGGATVTDSVAGTLTLAGGNLTVTGRPTNAGGTITGTTANAGGSNPSDGRLLTLTTGNTSGLAVGQAVTGTNITAGNYIAMIIDSTHVLLNTGSTSSTTAQANTLGAATNTSSQTYAAAAVTSPATVTVNNNGGGGTSLTFGGLSGSGNLTKAGAGTLVVNGASNTYSGTITVSAGTFQANGQVVFKPTTNGTSNKVTGAGAAQLNGTISLDLSAANIANGNSWPLVDVTSPSYSLVGVTGTSPALTFTNTSGVWTAVDGSNTWTFTQTTGTLSLTVAAGSGYSAWASTNAGSQTPDLDFDNDGVKNGVEYFMNATTGFTANPVLNGSNTVTWTNGGNIPSSAYGTTFVVQTSPDLSNWTNVPATGDPNLSNTAGSVSYTLSGSGSKFVRLAVTP